MIAANKKGLVSQAATMHPDLWKRTESDSSEDEMLRENYELLIKPGLNSFLYRIHYLQREIASRESEAKSLDAALQELSKSGDFGEESVQNFKKEYETVMAELRENLESRKRLYKVLQNGIEERYLNSGLVDKESKLGKEILADVTPLSETMTE